MTRKINQIFIFCVGNSSGIAHCLRIFNDNQWMMQQCEKIVPCIEYCAQFQLLKDFESCLMFGPTGFSVSDLFFV